MALYVRRVRMWRLLDTCSLVVCIAKKWFGRIVRLRCGEGGHGQRRHLARVSLTAPRGRGRNSLE